MTSAIGIGLTLPASAAHSWTACIPRIAGTLPHAYFDAPSAQFALSDGTELAAKSATQLNGLIASVGGAQTIEDGSGGYAAFEANTLPLSRAGLQAHPSVTRLHGEYPSNGSAIGAATASLPAWNVFSPVRVTSNGGSGQRYRTDRFSVTSGETIGIAALVKPGQGARCYLAMRDDDHATISSIGGAFGSLAALETGFGSVSGVTETALNNGYVLVTFMLTPNATVAGNAHLGIGPHSSIAGDYVDVIAAQVTDTPFTYSDWIMGGSGERMLVPNRNTLAYAEGDFAFAAQIDLRGVAAGTATRILSFNDGSDTNEVRLISSAGGVFQLHLTRGNSYVGTAGSGPAIPDISCVYGVAANGYLRLGDLTTENPAQTGLGALPAISTIAFDGVGFDATSDRAFKYLRRFAIWPVAAGSDSVFDAARAVAEDWLA